MVELVLLKISGFSNVIKMNWVSFRGHRRASGIGREFLYNVSYEFEPVLKMMNENIVMKLASPGIKKSGDMLCLPNFTRW